MITVTIEYFALLKEERGLAREQLATEAGTTAELFEELKDKYQFSLSKKHVRALVDNCLVEWDRIIREGDIIAFLPPVAGG